MLSPGPTGSAAKVRKLKRKMAPSWLSLDSVFPILFSTMQLLRCVEHVVVMHSLM